MNCSNQTLALANAFQTTEYQDNPENALLSQDVNQYQEHRGLTP